jgi:putative transposase
MKAFIDDHRQVYGVESICKVLRIVPSTYCQHAAPDARPPAREVWRQLCREGIAVARCTIERLMREWSSMVWRAASRTRPQ